jgi:two-component system response regulator
MRGDQPWDAPALLVDDSADDAAFILGALESNELRGSLVRAGDGASALENIFDPVTGDVRSGLRVVILDLKMPAMGGLDVLRRIRERADPDRLPVVILTSSGEPEEVARCYAAGANSYVVKPLAFSAFRALARRLVRYWVLTNAPNGTADPTWDPTKSEAPAGRPGPP